MHKGRTQTGRKGERKQQRAIVRTQMRNYEYIWSKLKLLYYKYAVLKDLTRDINLALKEYLLQVFTNVDLVAVLHRVDADLLLEG